MGWTGVRVSTAGLISFSSTGNAALFSAVSVDAAVERDRRKNASIMLSRVCSPSWLTQSRSDSTVAAGDGSSADTAATDELSGADAARAAFPAPAPARGDDGWLRDVARYRLM